MRVQGLGSEPCGQRISMILTHALQLGAPLKERSQPALVLAQFGIVLLVPVPIVQLRLNDLRCNGLPSK